MDAQVTIWRSIATRYTATATRLIGTDRGSPKLHAAMSILSDVQELLEAGFDERTYLDRINAVKMLICDVIDEQRTTDKT